MSVAKPYTRMVLEVLNMIHHKNRFVLIENNERKHDKHLSFDSICDGMDFGNLRGYAKY